MTNRFTIIFNQFLGKKTDQLSEPLINDRLKVAVAVIMIEMSRARLEINGLSYQQVFVKKLADYFKLSEDDALMLEKHADLIDQEETSLFPFTHLLNEKFDYEQKLELIKMLWEAAYETNGIDDEEDIYIHKVSKLLHVSYKDLMQQKPI